MVIKYQVFMADLILSFDLVDNQFGVTISFKVLYPYLLSELEANEQSIVLSYSIRAGLCQLECTRKNVILE